MEILLCEGGDVELGARTSKQILVFVFDPLTLTLSLFTLCLALFHIAHSYYMLGLFVWLSTYPSKCRGDLFCALPLRVEVVLVERGVVYSRL